MRAVSGVSTSFPVFTFILIVLIAYCIGAVFMEVFGQIIDTLLLCFCEDTEHVISPSDLLQFCFSPALPMLCPHAPRSTNRSTHLRLSSPPWCIQNPTRLLQLSDFAHQCQLLSSTRLNIMIPVAQIKQLPKHFGSFIIYQHQSQSQESPCY
jgi:hypothetical protein